MKEKERLTQGLISQKKFNFNLNDMYLIWFSKDPSIFLNPENQLRLVSLRAKHPSKKISLLYSSALQNPETTEQMHQFCTRHNIYPVDFELIRQTEGLDAQEYDILNLAKHELDNWTNGNRGGNPAAASDILRWSKAVAQTCGTVYVDFDKSEAFRNAFDEAQKLGIRTKHIEELEDFGSISSSVPIIMSDSNNDFIAFPVKENGEIEEEAIKIIEEFQKTIIENYRIMNNATNNIDKEIELYSRMSNAYPTDRAESFQNLYIKYKNQNSNSPENLSLTGYRSFVHQAYNPIDELRLIINNSPESISRVLGEKFPDTSTLSRTLLEEGLPDTLNLMGQDIATYLPSMHNFSQETYATAEYMRTSIGNSSHEGQKKSLKDYADALLLRNPNGAKYSKQDEDAACFLLGKIKVMYKINLIHLDYIARNPGALDYMLWDDPLKYIKDNIKNEKRGAILNSVIYFSGPAVTSQVFSSSFKRSLQLNVPTYSWQDEMSSPLSKILQLKERGQDISWCGSKYLEKEERMNKKATFIQKLARGYQVRNKLVSKER